MGVGEGLQKYMGYLVGKQAHNVRERQRDFHATSMNRPLEALSGTEERDLQLLRAAVKWTHVTQP